MNDNENMVNNNEEVVSTPVQTAPVVENSTPVQTVPVAENSTPVQTAPVAENSTPVQTVPVVENSTPVQTAPIVENSTSNVNNSVRQVPKAKKSLNSLTTLIVITVVIVVGIVGFFWAMWPTVRNSVNAQWKKPVIYLYPEEDTNISVKVDHPEKFSVTYPKYENGWNVVAKRDGTLIDKDGKKYYSLYWEGDMSSNNIKSDGFIVKGSDVSKFLEEKLTILGLNYKEREEFIIYWLPQLESNKYNYIHFKTIDEINDNMKLIIDPKPDTLIRVMMEYKPLDKKIDIKTQSL